MSLHPAFRFSLFAAAIAAMSVTNPVMSAPGDRLERTFRVDTATPGDPYTPDIASSANGDFVVTWGEFRREAGPDGIPQIVTAIFFRRYAADGTPKDASSISVIPDGYLSPCRRDPECADSVRSLYAPMVAMDDDGDFIITWSESYGYDGDAHFSRRYSANGVPGKIQEGPGRAAAAVAMDADGDYVIVSEEYDIDRPAYIQDTYVTRYSARGKRLGEHSTSSLDAGRITFGAQVDMEPDGDYVVAFNLGGYHEYCFSNSCPEEYIGVRRYTSDGKPKEAADIKVTRGGLQGGFLSDIAVDSDGDFVVTWTEYSSSSSRVHMRAYRSNGRPRGPAAQVNAPTSGYHLDAALGMAADGSFTVSWTRDHGTDSDVLSRSFRPDGTPTRAFHSRVNATTTGFQGSPAIAVNAHGSFVVAWFRGQGEPTPSDPAAFSSGIYAQRFAGKRQRRE